MIICSVILAATTAFLPYLWRHRGTLVVPCAEPERARTRRLHAVSALVLVLGLAGGVTAFFQMYENHTWGAVGRAVYFAQLAVQVAHVIILFVSLPWRTVFGTDTDTTTGKES